jgi:DNA-binding transcriptional ArsR family regulator
MIEELIKTAECKEFKELRNTLRVINNPTRQKILELLDKPKTVTELYIILRCEQSSVSQQLMQLRKVKLVTYRSVGKNKIYSRNNDVINNITVKLKKYLNS